MKKLFSLVLAGMIGGMFVLGGIYFMKDSFQNETPAPIARQVNNLNVPTKSGTTVKVPFDFTEAAAAAMPAVVHISSIAGKPTVQEEGEDEDNPFKRFFGEDFFFGNPFGGGQPRAGTGSGVIYTRDGYIITNNHVVEFADEVEVTLYDNRKFKAEVIGTDSKTDLAIIKIEQNNLPALQIADSDNAKVGEWVLAVGNPFDLTSTVTAGIISAKGRSINLLGGGNAIESFIQTDAAVNPGNSGGALVDTDGKLLGINTAIATRTGSYAGYSFAIPVNLVTRIADDIIEYGSFKRAFLGVQISELDSEYAEEIGVNISQGVVVESLIDGGSAQYSGILPKDVIVSVDGKDIKSVPELQEVVGRAREGDVLNLKVNRRGDLKDIPVRLKAD
jgi:Do/DeqQ family serine protease